MSRSTGSGLLIALALAACTPAGPVSRRPLAGLPRVEPVIRVGVSVDTAAASVSAPGGFSMLVADSSLGHARAGVHWTFHADGSGRVVGRGPGGSIGPVDSELDVRPRDGDVVIDGHPYRGGAVILSAGPGRVTVVNTVALERYLPSVVAAEMPPLAMEALKAQAVAARTYAIANLGERASLGFDVFAGVQDQMYGGIRRENAMADLAVRETRGQIVTYGGAPILAYYHSTCGGRTADISQVWRHAPEPYLRSVSDARPGGGYYCDASPRFRWHESWSGARLTRMLTRTLAGFFGLPRSSIGPIHDVVVEGHTTSGRVAVLRVDAGERHFRIRGDSIRWILKPSPNRILNSDLFELTEDTANGRITSLSLNGRGWGHGVGMCQMGAIGRARAGQNYRHILSTYYPGTRLTRLY